jgi:hypothetical protein
MRLAVIAAAGVVALLGSGGLDPAWAKSHAGYSRHHAKHHARHHSRHRRKVAIRAPYRGPAIALWQQRYEEPKWNPYEPYGYGTAYTPD